MSYTDPESFKHLDRDVETDIRLGGITVLNPFMRWVSSSRNQMFSSAISQHYVINGAEPNTVLNGAEFELGKYTNAIVAPHNMTVQSVIHRYVANENNGVAFNPQTIVVYSTFDEDTEFNNGYPTYGIIDIPRYSCNHPKFGFDYKQQPGANLLQAGNNIAKGTALYDTPAKNELGCYMPGRNLRTAYVSSEAAIEDTIIISKNVVSQLKSQTYTTRQMILKDKEFPLNLYGDPNVPNQYKVMPDIGEYCHPHGHAYQGIIMAKREYQPEMMPLILNEDATRILNTVTDTALDGSGDSARVIDIIVYDQTKAPFRSSRSSGGVLSPEVTSQLSNYAEMYREFCRKIVAEYNRIHARHNGNVNYTGEFNQLIVHAMAVLGEQTPKGLLSDELREKNKSISLVGNYDEDLGDYCIIVTTEYTKEVGLGYKVTDLSQKH